MPGPDIPPESRDRLVAACAALTELARRHDELVEQRDRAIAELSEAGSSYAEIGKLCGLSRGRVGQIAQNRAGEAGGRRT